MKKKCTMFILALLISVGVTHAQGNGFDCAPFIPNAAEKSRMDALNDQVYQLLQNQNNLRTSAVSCSNGGPISGRVYTLPVVFHVIDSSTNGSTIATNAQIAQALKNLNDQWRRVTGDGVDMQIQFAMAVRDPNGNPTNGINRVSGRNATGYLQYGLDPSTNYDQVLSLGNWPSNQYINIYILTKMVGSGANATTPGSFKNEGIFIIAYSGLFGNGNNTLTHEMGHYFGLMHTFESVFNNPNNPCQNDDCLLQGDRICDTPPVTVNDCNSVSCSYTGDPLNSLRNYMGYCGATTRFTQGQKDRVRAILFSEYRVDLLRPYALVSTTVSLEISIDSVHYVQDPALPLCDYLLQPKVKLRNLGTTAVTSVKLAASLAGNIVNTATYPVSLPSKGSQWVTLPPFTFTAPGDYDLSFEILQINTSRVDADTLNNKLCTSVNPMITADTVFVTADPPTGGVVTGNRVYTCGSNIDTVSVVDNPGYQFFKWRDADGTTVSTNRTIYIPVNVTETSQNNYLTAVFIKSSPTVSLSVNPVNSGTVSGGGTYDYQTNITVRARSNYGYQFARWEKAGVPVSTDSNYTFLVTESVNLIAVFIKKQFTVTISANPTPGGNPSGAGSYLYLDNATVRANTAPGYKFIHWKEGATVVSTDSVYTFSVTKPRNLIAQYDVVTGIVNNTLDTKISVYPNPASNMVTCSIVADDRITGSIAVITITGQVLTVVPIADRVVNTSFDVSSFPAGNYFLVVRDEKSGEQGVHMFTVR